MMRRWLVLFVLAPVLTQLALAQGAPQARYEPIFENEQVAVFRLDLAPHHSAPIYQNTHDVLWVALNDATANVIDRDGQPIHLDLNAGELRFFRTFQTRSIVNDSPLDFHGILVEIKPRGLAMDGCACLGKSERAICSCPGGGHLAKLWAVGLGGLTVGGNSMEPGQSFLGASQRGDILLIAVTSLSLVDQAQESLALELQPGQVRWLPRGRHMFRNQGSSVARYVTVEF